MWFVVDLRAGVFGLFFFFRSSSEGSHADNDVNDPWINTVTSIESIVARTGGLERDRPVKETPVRAAELLFFSIAEAP